MIYILVAFVIVSCEIQTKRTVPLKDQSKGIDSILVTYFCGYINSSVAIRCEKIAEIQVEHPANDYSLLSEGIVETIDTFIVDKIVLDRIKPLLEKTKTIPSYDEDARMFATVKYTDNTKDYICLGMEVPKVMFNREPMLIENELVYLLRKYSGYYEWFDMEDLLDFKEYKEAVNKGFKVQ